MAPGIYLTPILRWECTPKIGIERVTWGWLGASNQGVAYELAPASTSLWTPLTAAVEERTIEHKIRPGNKKKFVHRD